MRRCNRYNRGPSIVAIAVGLGVFVALFCSAKFLLVVAAIVLILVGICML
jgi:hypothetical protein